MSFPEREQPNTGPIFIPGPDRHFGHPSTWPAAPAEPTAEQPAPASPSRQRSRRGLPVGIGGGLVALIVVATATLTYLLTRPAGLPGSDPASATALITACHDAATRRLKSPATAKFSEDAPSIEGAEGSVTGVVDAQNGFGALIRNRYTCRATKGDRNGAAVWLVQDVTFSDWS